MTLAFDEAGRHVGRVRRWRDGWEAHYDARGLERPPAVPMGWRADEGVPARRVGPAGEAQRAVERYHELPRA